MDKNDKPLSPDNPVVRIGWEEFLGYGLLRFVNSFLHIFGLVIICEMEDGKVTSVYPARTIWRGFPVEMMNEAYRKVAKLMDRDHAEILKFTSVMECVDERDSSFLDEITSKQAAFANRPIDGAELNAAAEAILSRIKKLTDDPYNYSVNQVTINYVAVNDDKGTCKFWLDDNQKDILFNMTVSHFTSLVSNIRTKYGFTYSGSFGQRDGHAHLRWPNRL